jgi:MFS family permease
LGYWSDKSGGKFRKPYLLSIAVAATGGLIYFLAGAFTGPTAIGLIFLGRLLGGVGSANATLGFSYVAQVIPRAHLTRSSAVLSMVRVLGMAVAPGLNIFMAKVEGHIPLTPNFSIELTPLNTVGLFLFIANSISFVIIYVMLKEPPEATKPPASVDEVDSRGWKFWKSVFCLEILIPVMSVLTLNCCFQLLETGLAPAANDALGFGPTAISAIFGLNSILIFGAILVTILLSAKGKQLHSRISYVFACACPLLGKNNHSHRSRPLLPMSSGVTDENLLMTGLVFSIIGYTSMYLMWEAPSTVWQFSLPIFLATMAFPFMSAPTRSIFTKIVDSKENLMYHQGTLQAILSMAASVAGFAAPGIIAGFILRTPEEVVASQDHREFTPYALFAPMLSLITLAGVIYLRVSQKEVLGIKLSKEEVAANEEDALLAPEKRPSRRATEPNFNFHPKTEADRRASTTVMGIPQFSYHPAVVVLEDGEFGLTESDY